MNRDEALAMMVAPGDVRPQIYLGGVLQIWVTRACDKACIGCTQGSNLGGKPGMMTLAQYEQALDSLEGYFGVVGMFGGNPALHPKFAEMCEALKARFPYRQRGLWCNHPKGKGRLMRRVFHPGHSNLNVHLDQEAFDEFARDWPECTPWLKGLDRDSRHSPPFVAMQDVIADESQRWDLIGHCDINRHWSALIGVFRGELRGWFCELAASQSMLHEHEPDYPDTGVPIEPGWWRRPMADFAEQVDYHCHRCGIPLRGHGDLAITGEREQVSQTHAGIYKPKLKHRRVDVVKELYEIKPQSLTLATGYIENGETISREQTCLPDNQ